MSVKIRLKQTGKRNARTYRLVAVDEAKKRDGRVLEELGTVNLSKNSLPPNIDHKRISHWMSLGAQATATVTKLMKKQFEDLQIQRKTAS